MTTSLGTLAVMGFGQDGAAPAVTPWRWLIGAGVVVGVVAMLRPHRVRRNRRGPRSSRLRKWGEG